MQHKTHEYVVHKIKRIQQDISFPDADTDFAGDRRDDVVHYLINKYGQDYCAFVGTRLEYSAKSAIRDLSQVYDIDSQEMFQCTKAYNDNFTVEENIKRNKQVAKFFTNHPELVDKVDKLVGTVSALGTHAGGVIITDRRYPIKRYCALQRAKTESNLSTLWTKDELQPIGIVKYDILGLTTAGQCHLIKKMVGIDPYSHFGEDIDVYRDIILNLKNKNIFQFDTELGRRALDDLKPMSFMEMANASGIIRLVGSTEGREVYNQYKENVTQFQLSHVNYWKDKIREEVIEDKNYNACLKVLHESFGVLIYQEQLANLVVELSEHQKTFTDGNVVRKMLETHSKRFGTLDKIQGNKQALKQWHTAFMEVLNQYILPYLGRDGFDTQDKDLHDFLYFKLMHDDILPTPKKGIIKWIISAAAYLFNKLHAVAYTMNTYDMMYLKHLYPLEFWVGSLIYEQNNLDKVKEYLTAVKLETKIKVLPPNINYSETSFSISEKNIRYGLAGIMNVGEAAYVIVQARGRKKFKNLDDFFSRVDKKFRNKRVMEALLFTNAFSDFGDMQTVHTQLKALGMNLIDYVDDVAELSKLESKYLGLSITHIHPLQQIAAQYMPVTSLDDGDHGSIACLILNMKTKMTKKNKPYTMFVCQCLNSNVTFNVFDWNNNSIGLKKGEFKALHLLKQNGFIRLNMGSNVSSSQKGFYQKFGGLK